ncbi:MAG TPA: N-acetylmuramoyl-L-alanine amidase [Hyphomicrobiaceae bacterium]|nr:N-acetylmuramoyl-L-alanine amidase [Hyphomicrobiaceae bacterium]
MDRACSPLVHALHPSPNFEPRRGKPRADMLVLHYTGMMSAERAIAWLAEPASRVSSHYVIDEAGLITQMVAESERAWHAGVGSWAGETDINSASIGIEIQNPGHDLGYPDFPEAQMKAVADLSRDIVTRNAIPPMRVLAHSDVSPGRKIDPGEKFDWAGLHAAGVGHWVAPAPIDVSDFGVGAGECSPLVAEATALLAQYGYGITPTDALDARGATVVRSFQLHFRQQRPDGRVDRSTIATLEALLAAV